MRDRVCMCTGPRNGQCVPILDMNEDPMRYIYICTHADGLLFPMNDDDDSPIILNRLQ